MTTAERTSEAQRGGLLVIVALSATAWWLGIVVPHLGAPVSGLLLGIVLRNAFGVGIGAGRAITFCTKHLLKVAIVLVGAMLPLQQALEVGGAYLWIITLSLVVTMTSSLVLGRLFGVPTNLRVLVGIGTAICGATAILALGPAIRAKATEISYAVTVVFLFNLLAMVLFPIVGQLSAMPEETFGAWAGIAIHDTSSVLAAGFAYGDTAGQVSTVVKLTRTLFLIPFLLIVPLFLGAAPTPGQRGLVGAIRQVPMFIIGFVAMTVAAAVGLIPQPAIPFVAVTTKAMITVALVAIGLNSDLSQFRRLGFAGLSIGLAASLIVAGSSAGLLMLYAR